MATDITPIYFEKTRFDELTAIKRLRRRLKTGEIVKNMLLEYYHRDMTGRGTNKKVNIPKELYKKYLRWRKYHATLKDQDKPLSWKLELRYQYIDYYSPLDVIYIRIGLMIMLDVSKLVSRMLPPFKEEIFGGAISITSFEENSQEIERFRQFGQDIWKMIQKLWPNELKREKREPLQITMAPTGSGFEMGDFKRWWKGYRANRGAIIQTEKQLNSIIETNAFTVNKNKFFTPVEQFYLKLDEIARQKVILRYGVPINLILNTGSTPLIDKHRGTPSILTDDNKQTLLYKLLYAKTQLINAPNQQGRNAWSRLIEEYQSELKRFEE
jgi:hypothetical protein